MADSKADTLVLPSREVVVSPARGNHPIFQDLREEKQGAVKNLGEAGLTTSVLVSQDRKGKLQSMTKIVSHETREALTSLLDEEQLG